MGLKTKKKFILEQIFSWLVFLFFCFFFLCKKFSNFSKNFFGSLKFFLHKIFFCLLIKKFSLLFFFSGHFKKIFFTFFVRKIFSFSFSEKIFFFFFTFAPFFHFLPKIFFHAKKIKLKCNDFEIFCDFCCAFLFFFCLFYF